AGERTGGWLNRILRSSSEGGARRRYSFPTSTPRITGWLGSRAGRLTGTAQLFSLHSLQYLLPRKAKPETMRAASSSRQRMRRRFDARAEYRGILLTFVPLLSLLSPRLLPYRRRRVALRPSRIRRARRCRRTSRTCQRR